MRCKRKRVFAAFLALSLIWTSYPSIPVYGAKAVRSANIYSFTGEVSIKRGGDKLIPVFEGMRLEEGDTILTGSDSTVIISIDSDKTISVDAGTEVTLDALSGDEKKSKTSTSIFYGNTVNTIKNKLKKGSVFETKTSTAVMGVRGTSYLVSQDTEKVAVMVASGIVEVSSGTGEKDGQPEDTIPVAAGNQLQYGAGGNDTGAVPVDSDSLMNLTPAAAKALITDDFLENIPDKPEALTNVDNLVQILNDKQLQVQKDVQQKKAEQIEKTAQAKENEPSAFFAMPGEKLSGHSNQLLLTSENNLSASVPEPVKEIVPPAVSAKAQPAVENQAQIPAKEQADIAETPAQGESEPAAAQEKKPDLPGGGSGNSSSGNHSEDSGTKPTEPAKPVEPEKPTEPDKPVICVTGLIQDLVWSAEASAQPQNDEEQIVSLIVAWDSIDGVDSYKLELKEEAGEFRTITPQIVTSQGEETKCSIEFPKEEFDRIQGAVLKITPVTKMHQEAVAVEYGLNPETESSGTFRRLGKTDHISLQWTMEKYELSFDAVENAKSYEVRFGSATLDEPELRSDNKMYYTVTGPVTYENIFVKALGDGYHYRDGEAVEQKPRTPIELNELAAPKKPVLVVDHNEGSLVLENPQDIISACYQIRYFYEDDGARFALVSGVETMVPHKLPRTIEIDQLVKMEIRAYKPSAVSYIFLVSDWVEVTELENSALPAMLPSEAVLEETAVMESEEVLEETAGSSEASSEEVPDSTEEPVEVSTEESAEISTEESAPDSTEAPTENSTGVPSEEETEMSESSDEAVPELPQETGAEISGRPGREAGLSDTKDDFKDESGMAADQVFPAALLPEREEED